MLVTFYKDVDWEPLTVQLFAAPSQTLDAAPLRGFLGKWVDERAEKHPCRNKCPTKYYALDETNGELWLSIQWACNECVDRLLKDLAVAFPQIERAAVGTPEDPPLPPRDTSFIDVPARTTTMEDGQQVRVVPFSIGAAPVSTAEYQHFCADTGYVTDAQRTGNLHTFCASPILDVIRPGDRPDYPAMFLSFDDAAAYCQHMGVRLPADSELLTAITVDDNVRDISEADRAAIFRAARIPKPARLSLTSSFNGEKIIARRGPWAAKDRGWDKKGSSNRRLLARNDGAAQFFVCLCNGAARR